MLKKFYTASFLDNGKDYLNREWCKVPQYFQFFLLWALLSIQVFSNNISVDFYHLGMTMGGHQAYLGDHGYEKLSAFFFLSLN